MVSGIVNKGVELETETAETAALQAFSLVGPMGEMPLPFDFKHKGAESRVRPRCRVPPSWPAASLTFPAFSWPGYRAPRSRRAPRSVSFCHCS